ncbi:MAG: response regulator [Magnetococcales bacterium]|nr:response regulator [Magnetococcales bacterium]
MDKKQGRILIVDDEPTNIDILSGLLSDNYHTKTALTGIQALEQAAMEPQPDLILLDIIMPDMDGFDVCKRLKENRKTRNIPVIFITGKSSYQIESQVFTTGAVDFITKPVGPPILNARIKHHLALSNQKRALELQVQERTSQLEKTKKTLRQTMGNLLTIKVAPGVFWIKIPEAGLYILGGCPAEVVKHLMKQGYISKVTTGDMTYENGPNVILLSDVLVQNGGFSNLAEFPVLQMLYRQGMIIPGHPNNTGIKPLIMGSSAQVESQLEYIFRGNYGLKSKEEIIASGIDEQTAELYMKIKLKFAFGSIRPSTDLLDTLIVTEQDTEIRNGVYVRRTGFNNFRISYRDKHSDINLNLPAGVAYPSPYPLGFHRLRREYFAVLHSGEGDGWDINRPSMGSVLMFQGRIFLIDAGPGILYTLNALGIDVSEVDGVFHTHGHDDHFAGIPALIHSDRRLKYYATPMVRHSVAKKFSALMSLPEEKFSQFFDIQDLDFNVWNNCDGLEVKPLYSPHPVENNILLFRARDADGYKTYAHWSDLTSFSVLDNMAGDGPADIPQSFIDQVKTDYLQPVQLKKLDVGGGMIHGMAEDFRDDPSDRMILAHLDRSLTPAEMEIGSEATFGALDVFIPGRHDFQRQQAFEYIQEFMPEARAEDIRMLVNCPIKAHNAGSIIHRSGEDNDRSDMVISGTVNYLDSEANIHHQLSFGSLIGAESIFGDASDNAGVYRAVSHCCVLCISTSMLHSFLKSNGLLEDMKAIMDRIRFLSKTWLFGEKTTFSSLGRVARSLEHVSMPANKELPMNRRQLWMVIRGEVSLRKGNAWHFEKIRSGGFVGEHTYLLDAPVPLNYITTEETKLYRLSLTDLLEIPIVHWKMLEVLERRLQILAD